MKDGILIGLIIALLIVLGIGWFQYNKLNDSYNNYKLQNQEYLYKIDSLNRENTQKQHVIDSISLNISNLNKDLELLNKNKQELEDQLNQFTSSKDLSESVILLRDNIWNYSH